MYYLNLGRGRMFIFRRQGGLTAKKLAKLCGARCSKYEQNLPRNGFIINYGQNYQRANLNAHPTFNKLEASKILGENGVAVPKFFFKHELNKITDKDYPLLARKMYHSKGRDIVYLENKKDLEKLKNEDFSFVVRYLRKNSEYRVHILGKDINFVSVKIVKKDTKEKDYDKRIRSKERGWIHIEYKGEFKNKLIEIAKKAMEVLKYDFGAVDIIRDTNNKLWILEVNSAPGLEDRKLKMYVDYFKKEEEKWKRKS
jgi:D-alanine-D-alanine ligase-like ATP-grasp enzyme